MAIAGKHTRVKIAGSGVLMSSAEACTQIASSDSYKITNRNLVLWDRDEDVLVYENAILTSKSYDVDYLTGVIKFASTPTEPVTVKATYRPSSFLTWARTFSFSANTDMLDDTNFCNVETNEGFRSKGDGLSDVSGSIGGFFDNLQNFVDDFLNFANVIIEWIPNVNGTSKYYIEAKIDTEEISTDVEDLLQNTFNFSSTFKLEKEPA